MRADFQEVDPLHLGIGSFPAGELLQDVAEGTVQKEVHGDQHPHHRFHGELALPLGEGVVFLKDGADQVLGHDARPRLQLQVLRELAVWVRLA
jgi:hypothetical protein